MCGISGFSFNKELLPDDKTRLMLTWSLGDGIDSRGGDSCGFMSINGTIGVGKRPGKFATAKMKFLQKAACGHTSVLHARWATCGKTHLPHSQRLDEAHPFVIKRNNRTVLYGTHNGMVDNAYDSAERNDRRIAVDSEEIFHLLADDNYDGIKKLRGYGVICFVRADDPEAVRIIRLSSNSDIYIVGLEDNKGIVWGSTKKIVEEAVDFADLKIEHTYNVSEIGQEYLIRNGQIFKTNVSGIKFKDRSISYYSNSFGWKTWEKNSTWDKKTLNSSMYGSDDDECGGSHDDADSAEDLCKLYGRLENSDKEDLDDAEADEADEAVFVCEHCDAPVDLDDYNMYSDVWEQLWGTEAPFVCEYCLYNADRMLLG